MNKLSITLSAISLFTIVFYCSAVTDSNTCDINDLLRITTVNTVYSDSFDNTIEPSKNGWSHWFPDGFGLSAEYDANTGRTKAGSLCITNARQAVWQKMVQIEPGGLYRFSGWLKTNDAIKNEVGIALQPKNEKNDFLSAYVVENISKVDSDGWNKFEVIWAAPMSGTYGQDKIAGLDLEFVARSVIGKAWCDDINLEKINISSPLYDNFENSISEWELYITPGNESEGKVIQDSEGFADAGAISVQHTTGTLGLAASKIILRDKLPTTIKKWTLSVYCKAKGQSKPAIAIQQFDSEDNKLIEDTRDSISTSDWSPLKLTIELKEKTAALKILLVNNGKDTATFDNVLFRPAMANEKAPKKSAFPIRVGIYPADAIAAIDNSTPKITVPSGQTSAIGIHLAGEKKENVTTVIDFEAPAWLKLLTAQRSVYGTEPLKWETLPGKNNSIIYRFTNPYPYWSSNNSFNPYTNLLIVFQADANSGTEGKCIFRSMLNKDKGQERTITILVRDAIKPVPQLKDFHIGMWSFSWLNVLDDQAREKLLATYANAGFNLAGLHYSHGHGNSTLKKLGYEPTLIVHPPSYSNAYKRFSAINKPENMMVLANGNSSKVHHIALGLALNDEEVHKAYKKYIASSLSVFPESGKYIFTDVEFWGNGRTAMSCFHPSTISAFRKYANISDDVKLTPDIILKDYSEKWADFRLWIYVEIHRIQRKYLREYKPDMLLLTYDYPLAKGGKDQSFVRTSPMSTLMADPYVDGHALSTYNREGILFIETLENSVPYLKKQVWAIPFLMKEINRLDDKNYNYWQISAQEYRFEIVASAACGAKGVVGYPGELLDADYLKACQLAIQDIASYQDFYFQGKADDTLITLIEPSNDVRGKVHRLGNKTLLTIFNAAREQALVKYKYNDEQATCKVEPQSYAQIVVTER